MKNPLSKEKTDLANPTHIKPEPQRREASTVLSYPFFMLDWCWNEFKNAVPTHCTKLHVFVFCYFVCPHFVLRLCQVHLFPLQMFAFLSNLDGSTQMFSRWSKIYSA